jgi:hypothetical protein
MTLEEANRTRELPLAAGALRKLTQNRQYYFYMRSIATGIGSIIILVPPNE